MAAQAEAFDANPQPGFALLGTPTYPSGAGTYTVSQSPDAIPVIIVFFLAPRTFIQGITLTGVKG